ncbi:MAG: glycoside hydrolase family 13 protein [Firmicutes bacterium]|nr:glycoside hydrolase family 13 protein [Bacillota bacterium]
MELYHNSHSKDFRKPFGAVRCGGHIELKLKAPDADYAVLRLYTDEAGEGMLQPSLRKDGTFVWRFSAPEDDCVLWYFFVVGQNDNVYCYGNNDRKLGGEGRIYWQGETPESFQITVYHDFEVPAWYKEGIVYQIFPDRFRRTAKLNVPSAGVTDLEDLSPGAVYDPKTGRVYEDWYTLPYYIKNTDGSIAHWNFWGGTLAGIEEKLDYIKSLGATMIYLNPIFEARSNHRYDTSDYFRIDPMLGTEEDFRRLCEKARKLGIRIILDGVFNHTGVNSKYYREHPEWFQRDENGDVVCWWGVKDLPQVDELNPEFSEMICGENGVLRYWLRAGASGWRLDVADELPNEFLMKIRQAVKAEGSDKVVIGEVWEDASYKFDYGKRMRFLGGKELDSVMNYPVRQDILDYMSCRIGSAEFAARQMSRMENYPPEAWAGCFNMLGSHDRERILTLLGSEEAVKFAAAILYSLPGVPVIYYGDEVCLEGGKDPDNRRSFPWEQLAAKKEMTEHFRMLGRLRNGSETLKKGSFSAFEGENGTLVVERTFGPETAVFCFDRNTLTWKYYIRSAD